jgi:hypothetical protein
MSILDLNSKKKKKNLIFIIIFVLFSFSISSNALINIETTNISKPDFSNSLLDAEVKKSGNTDDLIELKVNISEIMIENINFPSGEKFQRLSIEGGGNLGQTGSPSLPFKTVKILLPYGKDIADIEIITGKTQILEGSYKIEPTQEQIPIGSDEITEFKFDYSIYNSNNPFPDKQYSIVGTYELRGYRILVLNLHPVSYIPKTGKVSYFEDMMVRVSLTKNTHVNSLFRNLKADEELNPEFAESYRGKKSQLISLGAHLDLPLGSYDYVIITNEVLLNSAGTYTFQDLKDSKDTAGIQTTIITTEYIYANYPGADNPEKIRNFIIDAYQTWGIEYVLLGGDGDEVDIGGESGDSIIPSRGFYATVGPYIEYNITSDLYYAGLDGNWNTDGDDRWAEPGEDDLYAEVYVGRAPVDSEAELSNFVYKTLAHETETHPYLSDVLMVGEDLGWYVWGGDYKDEVKDGSDAQGYSTEGFPSEYFVNTLYDRELDPARWDKNDLMPLINEGIHIINHIGHCNVEYSMKMVNFDADSLTNDHYFFGYSQGCYNGAFDNRGPGGDPHANDSIVEHFVTTPHGAFAFIGNSRYGWGDRYGTNGASQYYDRQFFDAIFAECIEEIGRANQDSKEDNIGFISQVAMRWVYYELNLMGDPTATLPPSPNDFAPSLTDGDVSPPSGDQTTIFNYKVNYTDADNNPPIYVNVLINGTSYPMEKQEIIDKDYTDGCIYLYLTYLQPGIYNYSFECADYKFFDNTGIVIGPSVSEKLNENSPILSNGQVVPSSGIKHWDTFEFSVIYSDADNNEPEYVKIELDSITYPMVKQNYTDSNYMDGCKYIFSKNLYQDGTHSYSFECSDGDFTDTIGPFSGPFVYELWNYTMILDYAYTWIDASGGTELELSDNGYSTQSLPFDFQFYNETFSTIYLGANGYLSFTDTSPSDYSNDPIPSGDPDNYYLIAPFWDDLYTEYAGGNGTIYVQSFGNYWVAEWENIEYRYGNLIGSFEVILYESGEIIFNYDYIDYVASGYTCGLNLGKDIRFYNSYQGLSDLTDDFAIQFTHGSQPGSFDLSSNAGTPDKDGEFDLIWTNADRAFTYSVYENSSYITEIDGSLTLLVDGTTDLTLPLSGYSNGTYYFIVEAHNDCGDTLSNCIEVVVENGPPPDFILSSNAGTPDKDGVFKLTWTSAYEAHNYSLYEYSSYITEINGSLTLLVNGTTDLTLPLSGYSDGTYYFIVVANNTYGGTLSNCIEIVVEIGPPADFILSSNAGTPDGNGAFDLTWESTEAGQSYSLYEYSSYITEINGSLTLLVNGTTDLTVSLSGYSNGTYYFIAVAYNTIGNTLSNCLEIVVQLPPELEPEPEPEPTPPFIPGYNLYIVISMIGIVSIILFKKRYKLNNN